MRSTLVVVTLIALTIPACGGSSSRKKKKPGTLDFATGAQNPGPAGIAKDAQDLAVLQMSLTAGPRRDVQVDSVTVHAGGTGDDALDIAGIEIWVDVDGDGAPSAPDTTLAGPLTLASDDGSTEFPSLGLVIPATAIVDLLVVYDMAGTATAGATFELAVPISDIAASVTPTGIPLVQGGLFTTAEMILSTGPMDSVIPADTTIAPGDRTRTMMQFRLTSNGPDGEVEEITLTAAGSGWDDQDLTSLEIHWDVNGDGRLDGGDQSVGGVTSYSIDDGDAIIPISDPGSPSLPFFIATGTSADFLVVYDFKNPVPSGTPSTYRARITDGTQVTTVGGLYVYGSATGKFVNVSN